MDSLNGYYFIGDHLFYKGVKVVSNANGISIILGKRFVLHKFKEWVKNKIPNRIKKKYKQKSYYVKRNTPPGLHRRVPVIAIDANGNEYQFESATAAAKGLNIGRSNIPRVLNGKYKTTGGYYFKFSPLVTRGD